MKKLMMFLSLASISVVSALAKHEKPIYDFNDHVSRLKKKFEKEDAAYVHKIREYCMPQTGSTRKFFAASAGFVLLGIVLSRHSKANQQAVFASYMVAAGMGLCGLAKYQWLCKTPEECYRRHADDIKKLTQTYRKNLEKMNEQIARALLEFEIADEISPVVKAVCCDRLKALAHACKARQEALSKNEHKPIF
jgi:hypothetical protein